MSSISISSCSVNGPGFHILVSQYIHCRYRLLPVLRHGFHKDFECVEWAVLFKRRSSSGTHQFKIPQSAAIQKFNLQFFCYLALNKQTITHEINYLIEYKYG